MSGNDGKLDCQLVIEMIGETWDCQFAQYPSQPDGPLKGAGGYICIPIDLAVIVVFVSGSVIVAIQLPMLVFSAPMGPFLTNLLEPVL